MPETLEILVDGGKATPGPPLGPALGPLGVNVVKVVSAINEKTKVFDGMKVPVKIIVDSKTKNFEITVGTPPTSALIIKELNVEKGSGKAGSENVGNLKIEQALKIARIKSESILGKTVKHAVKEVVGTCVSMGVTVEGKSPKEVLREIDEGKFDKELD